MAGWTGLETSSPRFGNHLTACELWSQRVECPSLATLNRVRRVPRASSRINPGRGDILETVTGSGPLISVGDDCAIGCVRCSSSTEFQNRDLDLPAKLLDVDRVAA